MTAPIVSLKEDSTIGQAAELFLRVRINSAPVVDESGQLKGIFAEKDILQGALIEGWWTRSVRDAMTRNVVCYEEDTPAPVVYDFLCRTTIRRIVVVKNGRPTGVISRGSLMRWLGNWGVTRSVDRPLPNTNSPSDKLKLFSNEQLSATAAALGLYSQRIEKLSNADPVQAQTVDKTMFELVDVATKIQEVGNDLLGFSQVKYRFESRLIDENAGQPVIEI